LGPLFWEKNVQLWEVCPYNEINTQRRRRRGVGEQYGVGKADENKAREEEIFGRRGRDLGARC